MTTFALAMRIQNGEAVAFSWPEWPYKEPRGRGFTGAMVDPRMQMSDDDTVFDGKRLIAPRSIPTLER